MRRLRCELEPIEDRLSEMQREVAAAVVDQHLGTDLVPLTVHRNFNGVEGTLQLRAKNLDPAHFERDPASLAFFDYLIGNRDRNAANSSLTKEGRLVAIDHGSAFQKIPGTPQISILEEDLQNIKLSEKTIRPEEIEFKKARQNQQPWPAQSEQRILRLQKMRTDMKNRTLELAKAMTPPQEVVSHLRQTTRQDWETLLGKELRVQQIDDLMIRQKKLLSLIDQSENLFSS